MAPFFSSTPMRRTCSDCCACAASGQHCRTAEKGNELAPLHVARKANSSWMFQRLALKTPMSALGQKRTCAVQKPMSALCQ